MDWTDASQHALREPPRLRDAGGAVLSVLYVGPGCRLRPAAASGPPTLADHRDDLLTWLRGELANLDIPEAEPLFCTSGGELRAWVGQTSPELIVAPRRPSWPRCARMARCRSRAAPCPILLIGDQMVAAEASRGALLRRASWGGALRVDGPRRSA